MRYNRRPMRRLGRILINALTVLSLLLFVALLLSWAVALALSLARGGAPRRGGPYVTWRDGPAHGYAVMVSRAGVSLEARSLPWPPRAWPSRGIYDPSPRHA